MAAPGVEALDIWRMSVGELRRWVEANPGRVNDRDSEGYTPLTVAAQKHSHSLVAWLLDEKGADVNATMADGTTALHHTKTPNIFTTKTPNIFTALMDRGADPILADNKGWLPLMWHAGPGNVDAVARLLQDSRVRATINMQDKRGNTALHHACKNYGTTEPAGPKVRFLLQAGADPTINNRKRQLPMDLAREHRQEGMLLLEEALADARKASLLVTTRRLAVASSNTTVALSSLQAMVDKWRPLPFSMKWLPGTKKSIKEECRKCRGLVGFLLGLEGGPTGEGMPADVFQGVFLDLLMPSWDPLRRKNAGTEQPVAQG